MRAESLGLLLVHLTAAIAGGSVTNLVPRDTTMGWLSTGLVDNSMAGEGPCFENILDDVTISDSVVSARVLAGRRNLIRLAEQLAKLEEEDEKTKQLIKKTLEKDKTIQLIVLSSETGDKLFYKSGDQEANGGLFPFSRKQDSPEPHWTKPIKDCRLISWLFGFFQPIVGSNASTSRRSLTTYFNVEELDQCQSNQVLGRTPKCDHLSTECVSVPYTGFRPDGYMCVCRPGFYIPLQNNSSTNISGSELSEYQCLRCPNTCGIQCDIPRQCAAPVNQELRTVLLSVQFVFMSTTVILAIVVFQNRKCKTIASGMWTIIELILSGCFILYGTVLVRWFTPSTKMCIIEPWCREIGFVLCYGAIILKLYRILIEFRTRKAHRWVVRDKDLLKYLLGMIIVVFGYMAAWTATHLDLITREHYSIVSLGHTHDGLSFYVCKSMWWDYVTQTGELLILVFGVHLSYASRNAVSQFQERSFLCMAISVEAIASGAFYVVRFIYWESMSPDVGLLAYFIRSHLTTTLVIALILVPKWYYHLELSRCRVSRHYLTQESGRAPFEAFKQQDGVTATGSDVEGEINLAEMSPDDIRAELKRLYTQLEVLKNKTIRFENPHISKRRGGRKMAHRRFSLQNLKHHAARNQARLDTDRDPSRTPEDSVCSNDGPSIVTNDGLSEITPSTPKRLAK